MGIEKVSEKVVTGMMEWRPASTPAYMISYTVVLSNSKKLII